MALDGFSDADFDALWRYFEQTCGVCAVVSCIGIGGGHRLLRCKIWRTRGFNGVGFRGFAGTGCLYMASGGPCYES